MRVLLLNLLVLISCCALEAGPRITAIEPVLPGLIRIVVHHGETRNHPLELYVPQDGDTIVVASGHRELRRDGANRGGITGPDGNGNLLFKPWDTVVRDGWDPSPIFAATGVSISSPNDPAYAAPVAPTAIHRKSKVDQFRQWCGAWPPPVTLGHVAYLVLPQPLVDGRDYEINLEAAGLGRQPYRHQPSTARSEALRVTHLGFRPDDPLKLGYLSLWKGTGGGHVFTDGLSFQVLEDGSGAVVYSGTSTVARRSADSDGFDANHSKADVHRLDFSSFAVPGRYRLHIPGHGCSGSFVIGHRQTWAIAARAALRGLYHHRSGLDLGAPFTDFVRPRNYHPEDGRSILASTATWCVAPSASERSDIFSAIVAGQTSVQVPAWGGYHDAGDWDRRPQHSVIPFALFTLHELNPDYWSLASWNIPDDGGLPDLLAEGLWKVDFYSRMQREDGAVRGMIEQSEHPIYPDVSWTDHLQSYATEPEAYSTWTAAAMFAWAARLVAPHDAARANGYRLRALAAMNWAEAWLPTWNGAALNHGFRDARNLAAIQLFRLTGDDIWHQVFLATTGFPASAAEWQLNTYQWNQHDQPWAAMQYHLASERTRDASVLTNCRTAIRRAGEEWLGWQALFAYGNVRNPNAPQGWGNVTNPSCLPLAMAHAVTGEERFLTGLIAGVQASLGANQDDRSYVTGIGRRQPANVLHIDSLILGVPAPEGIVVYGPSSGWQWSMNYFPAGAVVPDAWEWPVGERYMDLGYGGPEFTEYTVQQGMAPGAFVWGYLASRGLTAPAADRDRRISLEAPGGWAIDPSAALELESDDGRIDWLGLDPTATHVLHPIPSSID